jgi:hypothetical protein
MQLAERLDVRAAIVHRSLRLPGPPAVMATVRRSGRRMTICALQDQRSFFERAARRWSRVGISVPSTPQDSRRSLARFWVDSAASRRVIVETLRCAADFEIAKLAPSSRIVRLVRSAAHAIHLRCASEHDHGRPRRGSAGRRWVTAASRRRVMAASTSMREVVIASVTGQV